MPTPETTKPWSDVIPAADLATFGREFAPPDRPIAAGTSPALVVVDMTKAFVDSTYPTGWSPTGRPALAANAELLAASRRAGIPVFFTKAYPEADHRPRPAERGRWKLNPQPAPLAEGTPPGDVLPDELTPRDDEIVINKGSKPSAFFGTPLASYLIHAGCDTVIVTGMTTSGCVRATVLDAFQYNFHVVVPFECCADRSQISHKVNLFDIHMKYADVVSTNETIGYLESLPSLEPALPVSG
ncbi:MULTISPECIES: isochorismatase family protein [Amycolatopsis]|uniref:Nicotinamidase-related amidase n=1 Tax=Amycolatopsis thermoflava TaxID=84480 RepID=A0A3N2GPN1_9PSEU|nr:isochorismatase family protein [Amycolatopsis thermoflava]ROS38577.1 nicotinamidase-related amidase [Amycolatopsis thermoflava]